MVSMESYSDQIQHHMAQGNVVEAACTANDLYDHVRLSFPHNPEFRLRAFEVTQGLYTILFQEIPCFRDSGIKVEDIYA